MERMCVCLRERETDRKRRTTFSAPAVSKQDNTSHLLQHLHLVRSLHPAGEWRKLELQFCPAKLTPA